MATILDFTGKSRERSQTKNTETAWRLGELLAEPSQAVEKILSTKPSELVILNPDELEQYVFDELFQRTKGDKQITPEYILTLQYIAKNISNLYRSENSPYVYDAIQDWNYKLAWDTAVFWYIHFVWKRHNPLSREDYIHLAIQCYYRWYDRHPQSLWYIVATHIEPILTKIQNWRMDIMKRVPAFSVISGRV